MWRPVPAIVLLFGHASLGVAGVWTEDFTGTNGSTPPGWTITTDGGSSINIQNNTLYMNSPRSGGSGANSEAWGYPDTGSFPVLDDWDQTLPYRVEFDFMIPDTNNHWFFVYVDPRVHTVIDRNDDFRYRSGGNVQIMDLNTSQWYSIRYDVFPGAGYFDVYVDGALKRANAGFLADPTWAPFWIGDRHAPFDDYGSAYWDNLMITTNLPEPSALAVWSVLAGLGIALGWRRRRAARGAS